jgi:hypothetical protein
MAIGEKLSKRFFEILNEFGQELSKDLVESLRDKGVTHSGGQDSSLAGSIQFVVTSKPSIQFTMNDYWEYVEYGSRPSKFKGSKHSVKKIEALENWIQAKGGVNAFKEISNGLKLKTKYKDGKSIPYDKQRKTLAFVIAGAIAKNGTIKRFNYKGSKFIDSVLNDNRLERLTNRIAEEIGIDIEVTLSDKFRTNGN